MSHPPALGRRILVFILVMTSKVALASTYVYVGAVGDGNIGRYKLEANGTLKPGETVELGPPKSPSTPMAVSPDKHFLFAAVRTKPFSVVTFGIDKKTGALKKLSTTPLAYSPVYLAVDKEGHYLLGASYPGNLVSINPVAKDGQVGEPSQVVPTARFALRSSPTEPIIGRSLRTWVPTKSSSSSSTQRPENSRQTHRLRCS